MTAFNNSTSSYNVMIACKRLRPLSSSTTFGLGDLGIM